MTRHRFNEIFNEITYWAVVATTVIVCLWATWWVINTLQ